MTTTTTAPADKLQEAHDRLASEILKIRSGADWQRWMAQCAKFRRYSFGNTILIWCQRPDATMCAGYNDWINKHHRQVRKGEKGITILAPIIVKFGKDDPRYPGAFVKGFKTVATFDVSQTEGEPLMQDPRKVTLLEGQAPLGMWSSLASMVYDAGYTITRGDCGTANGLTDFLARTVRVRDDVSDAQACKTLAHELGHIRLHEPKPVESKYYREPDRALFEVEAESVAFLVCDRFGLVTDDYSFGYVAHWALSPNDVEKTGQRVTKAAKWITDTIFGAEDTRV